MTAAYTKARQELQNVKKEVKKEKKKTAVISNPVNQSELHELCRNLQFDKEVGCVIVTMCTLLFPACIIGAEGSDKSIDGNKSKIVRECVSSRRCRHWVCRKPH